MPEVSLLLYFNQFNRSRQSGQTASSSKTDQQNQPGHLFNRRKLADIMGMPRTLLSASMQKMTAKGLIKVEEVRGKKGTERQIRVLILPAAGSLLEDLDVAEMDYNQARFAGFQEEELEQYTQLSERMKENIQRILQ